MSVALTYARALFDLATDQDQLLAIHGQLLEIARAFRESPDLKYFAHQPNLEAWQKVEILDEAFANRLDPVLQRLLQQLAKHERLEILTEVAERFQRLLDEQQRVLAAEVTTVVSLTPEQETRLSDSLKHLTGYDHVRLHCQTDSNLLGGVVLRIRDLVVDGSIRGQLQQLQKLWC